MLSHGSFKVQNLESCKDWRLAFSVFCSVDIERSLGAMARQPLGLAGLLLEHARRASAPERSVQLLPRVRQETALAAARERHARRPADHVLARVGLLALQRVVGQT